MVYGDLLTTDTFEKFKEDDLLIEDLKQDDLINITKVLHRKLIKNQKLYKFRDICKSEISRRKKLEARKTKIIKNQVPILNHKLMCSYDVTFFLHSKLLQMMDDKCPKNEIEDYLKDAGRTVGSKLYDLPSIQTGLYSLDALKNIKKTKSHKDRKAKNTNEHFFSLYANAGPFILRKAILKTQEDPEVSYTFKLFVRMVSRLNQTIKTTISENNRLQQFHRFNTMIGVQDSYENANVSPIIDCGTNTESDVYLKWSYMCQNQDLPLKIDAGKHFKKILKLEDAINKYPELVGVEKYLYTK